MQYKLRMYANAGCVNWEYVFESRFDRYAFIRAQAICMDDPAARTCSKVALFNLTTGKTLAEFAQARPSVNTKVLEPIEGIEL